VEVHAAAASLSQLSIDSQLPLATVTWGLVLLLLVSSLAKTVLAFASGGAGYGWRMAAGLMLIPVVASVVLLIKAAA
jgi:hypothetical protein